MKIQSAHLLVFAFATSIRIALADPTIDAFVYPGPSGPGSNFRANLALPLGSEQTIQWISNKSIPYSIALYHQDIAGESGVAVENLCDGVNVANTTMTCNWRVQLYDTNLTFSPVYFFWHNAGWGPGKFTSHYFNITDPATSSAAAAQISTTTTSSSLSIAALQTLSTMSSSIPLVSTASAGTAASATDAAVTSIATSNKADNTVALSVGLGVGLGVGIPLVLLAGIFVGLKVVKQRRAAWTGGEKNHSSYHPHSDGQPAHYHDFSQPAPTYYAHDPPRIYEAPIHQSGSGPNGEYEAGSKTPRYVEMD